MVLNSNEDPKIRKKLPAAAGRLNLKWASCNTRTCRYDMKQQLNKFYAYVMLSAEYNLN